MTSALRTARVKKRKDPLGEASKHIPSGASTTVTSAVCDRLEAGHAVGDARSGVNSVAIE